MANVRYLVFGACSVAVLLLASRSLARPSPSHRSGGPLPPTQMASIMGGSENGSGCVVVTDSTTCAYVPPATGPATSTLVCDDDTDRANRLQDAKQACQGQYDSGVGDVKTAGLPASPNTNQPGPSNDITCRVTYTYSWTATRTFRLACGAGFPHNATKVVCSVSPGKRTAVTQVRDCNDP
jgi:hypothetical protein